MTNKIKYIVKDIKGIDKTITKIVIKHDSWWQNPSVEVTISNNSLENEETYFIHRELLMKLRKETENRTDAVTHNTIKSFSITISFNINSLKQDCYLNFGKDKNKRDKTYKELEKWQKKDGDSFEAT